jgi:dolichol-phosphate mannosyltransferase
MPRVSLIMPLAPEAPDPASLVPPLRAALEDAGHEVDVLVVSETGRAAESQSDALWRAWRAASPGSAAAAVEGLTRAEGEILLVLDPTMGYAPGDLARVVEPLARGEADLAVASRAAVGPDHAKPRLLRALAGWIARPMTGTSDPISGLIGLTRDLRDEAGDAFRAVGTKFSFELLAKLGGRWVDVPVRTGVPTRFRRPEFDDIRHLKRLSDHRFGNLSHLVQFCVVGGSGMIVDLTCYFIFQWVFNQTSLVHYRVPPTKISLALAVARGLAIAVALCWNFSLNRRLTFSYARQGSIARQFLTYLLGNALSVALSMGLSLGLPRKVPFFDAHKLAAAVVGIVVATGVSFAMSRWVVFRHRAHPHSPRRTRRPDATAAVL